mgnify:FL=1|jgi:hypothetical protein|tara:strand:- start:133 stop:762 length:630 start_codon:yes stop_codon:yes gene_type:complete
MRWNVLGNGDNAHMFERGQDGRLLICNMPPFEIPNNEVYATCMVDYKMMLALAQGHIKLDMYDWVLGMRPRHWMEMNPAFYLKYAQKIKAMHTHIPQYAQLEGQDAGQASTNYSCGHMAIDYACRVKGATEVHIYGFDAMFDTNLRSYTDLLLESDRSEQNTYRIANNWRPVWTGLFKEFKHVKFYLYHKHDRLQVPVGKNVTIIVKER